MAKTHRKTVEQLQKKFERFHQETSEKISKVSQLIEQLQQDTSLQMEQLQKLITDLTVNKRLRETAALRNPDEFNFKMIKARSVGGVHCPKSEAKKCTKDELMLMKTRDMGYVLQKLQREKKKIEKLTATLHSVEGRPSNKHIYYAEDREEAREIMSRLSEKGPATASTDISDDIKRRLEARKNRASQLEKLYMDMTLQKELQKKGRKRKLREDEIVNPTSKPVYKWRPERKR